MKKGRRLFCCLLVLLMTALTGCGGASSGKIASSKSDNEITLTFISSWGGNDTKATAMQQILDKFCADNPGIKISNQSVFGDDFLPYLKTAFISGNDPDVFGLWPGSDINSLIKAGRVADLTGMIDGDTAFKSSFGTDMWQYVTANNRIYGLPVEIVFEGLFINRDLFTKYNVAIPYTYAQLLEAVGAFKKAGIIPIAYNNTAEGTYIYQNIAASIGGKSAIENPFDGGGVNACYIEAMRDMHELYQLGAFPGDYTQIDSNERNDLFKNKQAAMIVQGSWYTADVYNDSNVAFIRFPNCSSNPSASRIVYGLGNGVFHLSQKAWNSQTRNQAAVKLLRYIASRQSAALLASQTGMLSNVDLGSGVAYNDLTNTGLSLIKGSSELIGPPDSYIARSAWQDVIVKNFPSILEGTMKPEDVWGNAIKNGAAEN